MSGTHVERIHALPALLEAARAVIDRWDVGDLDCSNMHRFKEAVYAT